MSQITTHILDTARGCPAVGVAIALHRLEADVWQTVGQGVTDDDGRVSDLCPAGAALPAGTYRMHFATGEYFSALGGDVFYPWADVVFSVDASGAHYHVPLLLSPFGYSTYRGS